MSLALTPCAAGRQLRGGEGVLTAKATLRHRLPHLFLVPIRGRRIDVSIADLERAQLTALLPRNCQVPSPRMGIFVPEVSSTLSFAMVGGSLMLPPVVIPVPVCRNDVRVQRKGVTIPGICATGGGS